jgi:hypothetical protein
MCRQMNIGQSIGELQSYCNCVCRDRDTYPDTLSGFFKVREIMTSIVVNSNHVIIDGQDITQICDKFTELQKQFEVLKATNANIIRACDLQIEAFLKLQEAYISLLDKKDTH